ncbi:helix-turn-helix transcriptional regulator [Streptomyces mirabilis]|uniref:helix-turn-helix transcriptional regulator n=1 Tax=Streptomyces mirabilis TaxID=68239 RepID=UPI0036B6A1C7
MEATHTTETLEDEPQGGTYIRVRSIAEYFDVGLSTIYGLIESGVLPAIAIGQGARKALRVHRSDFEAYEAALRAQQAANPSVL